MCRLDQLNSPLFLNVWYNVLRIKSLSLRHERHSGHASRSPQSRNVESVRILVEQSLGIQFLLEPATGSIIAASRGATDLLPACHTRGSNVFGDFGAGFDGNSGAGKDDPIASGVQYLHQFLFHHTAETWQKAVEPLLCDAKELINIATHLVDLRSSDEHMYEATSAAVDWRRHNSSVYCDDLAARNALSFTGEEVYIDVQMHCRSYLLAICHPTAKYWQKAVCRQALDIYGLCCPTDARIKASGLTWCMKCFNGGRFCVCQVSICYVWRSHHIKLLYVLVSAVQ